MADDFPIATAGAGTQVIRAYQLGGGQYAQVLFVAPARQTPVGPPEKTAPTTGSALSLSPPGGATHAVFSVETNPVRWYNDGTTPTSANGLQLQPNNYYEIDLAAFTNFKYIASTGTASVQITYWKYV